LPRKLLAELTYKIFLEKWQGSMFRLATGLMAAVGVQ